MVWANSMIIRIKQHSRSTEHILLFEKYRKKTQPQLYYV